MNFKRLLYTDLGIFFVSVLLGFGLATLFRKACEGKNCINFNGPVISEIDGKTYKYGEYCYKYNLHAAPCDPLKKTVGISSKKDLEQV
jgi:hypothetical protein